MANKNLFKSTRGRTLPKTTTKNRTDGTAYEFGPEHALAQLAATGTFADTFYGDGVTELDAVKQAADKVSPEFMAKVAVFARQQGHMKDMPVALLVMLSKADSRLFRQVFPAVVDNARQLRTFVQLVRSGQFGRKSLGSVPTRMVQQWLKSRSDRALFRASVGNSPSLRDIIKLTRPKAPLNSTRANLYGYLLGCDPMGPGQTRVEVTEGPGGKVRKTYRYDPDKLPEDVQQYEAFKKGLTKVVPDVEFRMLTSLPLSREQWAEVARRGYWHQTRMNLNTYKRHGVFEVPGMTKVIADKLRDPQAVRKAKIFPYQLLMAYLMATDVPFEVREALQDAMEIAVENIPKIEGRVLVFPDISGSMSSPVTGSRGSATSKVNCKMVAALVASAFLRTNRNALILPFHNNVQSVELNPRDSVMTNAQKLAALPSGGTSCSAPLEWVNRNNEQGDLIVYVSDNESWMDSNGSQRSGYWGNSSPTATLKAFEQFKRNNPNAKMVCLDLAAGKTTQAACRDDIMNIGGFSDSVFTTIARFVGGQTEDSRHWVSEIEKINLDTLEVRG